MKPVITRIKFSDSDLERLTKILNDREWGGAVAKLKVTWSDRMNAWLLIQALDKDNKILYSTDLLFY